MTKKSRKPKEYLLEDVLEDLKNTPDDSLVIHPPEGFLASDSDEKEDQDRTTVLGEDQSSSSSHEPTLVLGESSDSDSSSSSDFNLNPNEQQEQDTNETRLAHRPSANAKASKEAPKVSYGGGRGKYSPYEAQFAQAENLKMAQQRILDLEKTNENLRRENEVLSSAAEISRQKMDELVAQIHQLEKQRHELRATNESELQIFKEGLAAKEAEIQRLRAKVDELESRLSKDLRKVRVRERELENRLELSKAEKAALLRAKDEAILELKRQNENLDAEIERYQNRVIELGQKIELNQEQFARTVRALRLALTNLEVSDGTSSSITLAPLKKAE